MKAAGVLLLITLGLTAPLWAVLAVMMVIYGQGAWLLLVPLALVVVLGIPWAVIQGSDAMFAALDHVAAHAREIWQVQVRLRWDARTTRVQTLKYPTYIRRWYPERRMAHMRATHAFDLLMKALDEEARLYSQASTQPPSELPSCDSSSTPKGRSSSKRARDARGRFSKG